MPAGDRRSPGARKTPRARNRRRVSDRRSGNDRRVAKRRVDDVLAETKETAEERELYRDKRRFPRHDVERLPVKTPVVGWVLNASPQGMAIETSTRLNVGWSYAFRMGESTGVIRIPGRVQWCRLVRTLRREDGDITPVYHVGVALAGSLWSKPQTYSYP